MDAGSCGAIQGANSAKMTKIKTRSTPIAANGLWRAFPARLRRNEIAAVDMDSTVTTISQVGFYGSDESTQNRHGWKRSGGHHESARSARSAHRNTSRAACRAYTRDGHGSSARSPRTPAKSFLWASRWGDSSPGFEGTLARSEEHHV